VIGTLLSTDSHSHTKREMSHLLGIYIAMDFRGEMPPSLLATSISVKLCASMESSQVELEFSLGCGQPMTLGMATNCTIPAGFTQSPA